MTPDPWSANPFLVLGLSVDADGATVEREGRRLLAQLEVGVASVGWYDTPVGRRRRTVDDVRLAMAALRDPETRLRAEPWALVPVGAVQRPEPEPWTEAFRALGWGWIRSR